MRKKFTGKAQSARVYQVLDKRHFCFKNYNSGLKKFFTCEKSLVPSKITIVSKIIWNFKAQKTCRVETSYRTFCLKTHEHQFVIFFSFFEGNPIIEYHSKSDIKNKNGEKTLKNSSFWYQVWSGELFDELTGAAHLTKIDWVWYSSNKKYIEYKSTDWINNYIHRRCTTVWSSCYWWIFNYWTI